MNDHYQTLILGGGLSGLTVAHKLRLQAPAHNFLVIEKKSRTGGVIKSHHEDGFITELGPHGFLDNCEESKQILKETGLDEECVKAPLIDFVRYVYFGGKLNLIPQTPLKILRAPLIPWHAKLRVLGDLWKPYLEGEPTVAKWASYRFGAALLPYLDAVYTGTYAGDFDRLTIDSVMPGVRALEKEHGSVILALFKKMRGGKQKGQEKKKFSMPAMTSFPGGMERLVERLSADLRQGQDLLFNTEITGLQRDKKGWRIQTSSGSFTGSNLVLALPINSALQLLAQLRRDLPLQAVPQTSISTVAFGFTDDVSIPPGFGFLTPEVEQRFTLGTLFSSNMFPGRAPDGHIVFETLVGGRRHPEKLQLSDSDLTARALADVKEILRIKQNPVYTTVLRSGGAIPQLERDYPELLRWRDTITQQQPGLHVCGFGWEGIGLNDMMKTATRVATNILTDQPGEHATEVKGVYF
jgi:oxygen-dependent protoporphyrinogen oxidase